MADVVGVQENGLLEKSQVVLSFSMATNAPVPRDREAIRINPGATAGLCREGYSCIRLLGGDVLFGISVTPVVGESVNHAVRKNRRLSIDGCAALVVVYTILIGVHNGWRHRRRPRPSISRRIVSAGVPYGNIKASARLQKESGRKNHCLQRQWL